MPPTTASRLLARSARAASQRACQSSASAASLRAFHSSPVRRDAPSIAPVKKPVGAFRGGLFGFLLGATSAGAAMYYYVVDEYRVSNELLTEDIYALQSAVQRIEGYVQTLEAKVDAKRK